jgi:hypothetical protein
MALPIAAAAYFGWTKFAKAKFSSRQHAEAQTASAIQVPEKHAAEPIDCRSIGAASSEIACVAPPEPAANADELVSRAALLTIPPVEITGSTSAAGSTSTEAAIEGKPSEPAKVEPLPIKPEAPKVAQVGVPGCVFNINSMPSSRVAIDGHDLGATPKLGFVASPGMHVLTFATEDTKKVVSAPCKPGEHRTIAMRLTQE